MQRTLLPVVNRLLAEVPDQDLLERYVLQDDQDAFTQLVTRYNRLVWGQCRNLLANDADAEDAFQATFLPLARSAKALRVGAPLGPWLHGVAYRVCMNARRVVGRRAKLEATSTRPDAQQPVADSSWDKAFAAVAEEVQSLPEAQRAAFVLCYLEGRSVADAAAGLGSSSGRSPHDYRGPSRLCWSAWPGGDWALGSLLWVGSRGVRPSPRPRSSSGHSRCLLSVSRFRVPFKLSRME